MSATTNKTDNHPDMDRRSFLTKAGLAGVSIAGAALLAGCGGSSSNSVPGTGPTTTTTANMDTSILQTAIIAETLAVTTYSAIIAGPLFTQLNGNLPDQQYLQAALEEEQIHLDLLVSATGIQPPVTAFYFPAKMFTDAQTTISTLVTFEEAFIAAYLLGVQQLSTVSLKLLAAQIMGNESEHRVLARVIGNDLGLASVSGLYGTEPIAPSNNFAFEKTAGLTAISQAAAVLNPYISATGASTAGFTQTKVYAAVSTTGPQTLFSSTPS